MKKLLCREKINFTEQTGVKVLNMSSVFKKKGICLLNSRNDPPGKTGTENIQLTTVMRNLKFWEKGNL